MPPKINLFCPSLYGDGGHEKGYTEGVTKALNARKIETCIIYPIDAPDLFSHNTERVKLTPRGDSLSKDLLSRFKNKLAQRARQAGFDAAFSAASSDTITLIHTAGFADMALAGRMAAARRRRAALIMRYDHYDDLSAIAVLKALASNPWVSLMTDSHLLAEMLEDLLGKAVPVLPPPVDLVQQAQSTPSTSLRLAYLGGARRSKGFDHLLDILQAIRNLHPETDLFAQAYRHSEDAPSPTVEAALKALSHMTGVELETGVMNHETYLAQLTRANAVLLPYDTHVYRAVTSGVFVEAISAGKFAIVPDKTWMADEARRYGLTRALIVDFSSKASLDNALAQTLSGDASPCAKTINWARAHTYDALADSILAALEARPGTAPFLV